MKPSKYIYWILLLVLTTYNLSGQNEQLYYDFMVDHYPKVIFLKTKDASRISPLFGGEFIEVVERLSEKVYNGKVKVARFSGFVMASSGIYPQALLEVYRWIKIVINDKGELEQLEVYTNQCRLMEDESKTFQRYLEGAKINPALKGGENVRCVLYYQIESE